MCVWHLVARKRLDRHCIDLSLNNRERFSSFEDIAHRDRNFPVVIPMIMKPIPPPEFSAHHSALIFVGGVAVVAVIMALVLTLISLSE